MDFEDLNMIVEPAEVGRAILNRRAVELRADPALPAAIRADVLGALEMFDRNDPYNRAVNDIAVFVLGMVALALHYSVGLSHRTLRNWGGRGGLVSAGRATAILWRLRDNNLILAAGPQESGKRMNFLPQPGMIDVYRRRLSVLAGAAGRVNPEVAAFAPRLTEDAPFRAFILAMSHGVIASAEKPDPTLRTLEQLTHRTHGSLILYCMLKAAYDAGAERPGGSFVLSIPEIVNTLGASRSHVRGFVAAMERAGFLERGADGSVEARLTPAFTEVYEAYYSTALTGMGDVIRQACRLLDHAAESGKI